jgi:hypothetical protein
MASSGQKPGFWPPAHHLMAPNFHSLYSLTLSIIGLMSNNQAIDFFVMAIVITPSILSSRNLAQEALADSEAEGFGL